MEDKNKIPNLQLAKEKAEIYSQVDGLSLQNLFYVYNNYFPNCFMFTRPSKDGDNFFDTSGFLKYLEENTPENEYMETIKYMTEDLSTNEIRLGFCVLLHKSNIFARIERSISESYVLFGNGYEDKFNSFKTNLYKYYRAPEEEKNNLYTISQDSTGFHLLKSHIKEVKDFNIKLHYNDDFPHEDEKIKKFINDDNKSGLVILHGEKGTGKTTYIRHLITTFSNRKFVFVPSSLIELLGQPSFASFLLSLNNHVIILEDCENAIRDRKTNYTGSAVSLLLNMSDGLLSDDLGTKFICTFNEDVKNIDEALTRKGRLVSMYEFKALNVDKTNELLNELTKKKACDNDLLFYIENENTYYSVSHDNVGYVLDDVTDTKDEFFKDTAIISSPKSEKPLTLADIFNYDDDSYVKERKKII